MERFCNMLLELAAIGGPRCHGVGGPAMIIPQRRWIDDEEIVEGGVIDDESDDECGGGGGGYGDQLDLIWRSLIGGEPKMTNHLRCSGIGGGFVIGDHRDSNEEAGESEDGSECQESEQESEEEGFRTEEDRNEDEEDDGDGSDRVRTGLRWDRRIDGEESEEELEEASTDREVCAVCLEALTTVEAEDSEEDSGGESGGESGGSGRRGIQRLACRHGFHDRCLSAWAAAGPSRPLCPCCRTPIVASVNTPIVASVNAPVVASVNAPVVAGANADGPELLPRSGIRVSPPAASDTATASGNLLLLAQLESALARLTLP